MRLVASPVPSLLIVKISGCPFTKRTKAIWAPSCDQLGSLALVVTTFCPDPSAFMVQTSPLRVKAICLPSGDQAGLESVLSSSRGVRGLWPDPFAFIT